MHENLYRTYKIQTFNNFRQLIYIYSFFKFLFQGSHMKYPEFLKILEVESKDSESIIFRNIGSLRLCKFIIFQDKRPKAS